MIISFYTCRPYSLRLDGVTLQTLKLCETHDNNIETRDSLWLSHDYTSPVMLRLGDIHSITFTRTRPATPRQRIKSILIVSNCVICVLYP